MIEHMIVTAVRDATLPIPITDNLDLILGPEIRTDDTSEDGNRITHDQHADPKERVRTALELLYHSNRELLSEPELYDMLTHVLQALVDSLAATSGSLLVLDHEGQVKDGVMAYRGLIKAQPAQQLMDVMKQGLAGWVIRNNKPALVSSTKEDPRWLPRSWDENSTTPRSAISLPLLEDDRIMAVITLVRSQSHQFTRDELAQLTTVALLLSIQDYANKGG
jgi:signal transduction protein with GAF and PtsI domain